MVLLYLQDTVCGESLIAFAPPLRSFAFFAVKFDLTAKHAKTAKEAQRFLWICRENLSQCNL